MIDQAILRRYARGGMDLLREVLSRGEPETWFTAPELAKATGFSLGSIRTLLYQIEKRFAGTMLVKRTCLRSGCFREYQLRDLETSDSCDAQSSQPATAAEHAS